MPPGDLFGDMMNAPAKYVVSKTLGRPIWRNTTIIRDDAGGAVRGLKARTGKNILLDGSSQLLHAWIEHDLVDELYLHVYPLAQGSDLVHARLDPVDRGDAFVRDDRQQLIHQA